MRTQTHWDDHKTRLIQQEEKYTNNTAVFHQSRGAAGINVRYAEEEQA